MGGEHWRGRIVPIYIDNKSFQQSGVKGWSRAERLNDLLKDLFRFSVRHGCVFWFFWISTLDNVLADALSRPGAPATFFGHPRMHEFLQPGAVLTPHAACGGVRLWGKGFSSSTDGDGPSRQFPMQLTVSYTRASIYTGLPSDATAAAVDVIMDKRSSASSRASVKAALGHWGSAYS